MTPTANTGQPAVVTLHQALEFAAAHSVARLDAQMMLLHALAQDAGTIARDRAWLAAHADDFMTPAASDRFDDAVRRRAQGEPLAYVTGEREFFGLPLQLDARVLIPRADTETLVQWAIEILDGMNANGPTQRSALDLGTGSGAIALALKHQRPALCVDAIDADPQALQVAISNATRLDLKVGFAPGNWLQGVTRSYDLIVSNPPYIAPGDHHLLHLVHEPRQALVSGGDGLDDLRKIIGNASCNLHPGGWLIVEHGYDQADRVRKLFLAEGYTGVVTRRDLAQHERCSGGRRS